MKNLLQVDQNMVPKETTETKIIAIKLAGKFIYSVILEIEINKQKWLTFAETPKFNPTGWFQDKGSLRGIILKHNYLMPVQITGIERDSFQWVDRQNFLNGLRVQIKS